MLPRPHSQAAPLTSGAASALPRPRRPELYIIHGWTYTTAPWTRTLSLLEKQGITVHMLHVPGLTAPSDQVCTIADYAKWADQAIPDGAIALGHSNGGRILLNLCSAKPQKLRHLILLDSAGVYTESKKRDLARPRSHRRHFPERLPGLTKTCHKLPGPTDYARAPENMKRTLSNMLDSDRDLNLAGVTTPTSILWGANDTVTPPRQAEVLHAALPYNTLEVYPEWTHAPYLSHPDALAAAIVKALQHPPRTPAPAPKPIHAPGSARAASTKLSPASAHPKGNQP